MKVVITDAGGVTGGDIDLSQYGAYGDLTVYEKTEDGDVAERIKDADIILINRTKITAEAMAGAKNLRFIGIFATGFNTVDVAYAKAHGITVSNVPGYSTEAVAQHAFALLLGLIDRVGEYNGTMKARDAEGLTSFARFPLPRTELCGKTIGLVGYGAIGHRVADIALAFGLKVLVYKRHPVDDGRVEQVTLDELLRRSDIVSLHCPLNADSENMMDAAAFAKMKDGAYFINTARGGLVDEQALRDALDNGKLSGAGIDVLRREPITEDCPLYEAKNCLITPHVAWAGYETRVRLFDIVHANIRAFLDGKPQNVVG